MASLARTSPRGRWSLAGVAAFIVLTLVALLGSAGPVAATQPPRIASLSPDHAPAACGVPIHITGNDLQRATAVKFGSHDATIVTRSATELVVICPPGSFGTKVSVTVIDSEGSSAPALFTYDPEVRIPAVASLSPQHGPPLGGNEVILTGRNLDTVFAVKFGGKPAELKSKSSTAAVVIAPGGVQETAVDVVALGEDGASPPLAYRYDAHGDPGPPTIDTLTPDHGPLSGGNEVVIAGSWNAPLTTVRFDRQSASIVASTASTVTVVVPAGPSSGPVDVTVIDENASSDTATYTYDAPPQPVARAYDVSGSATLKTLVRGTFAIGGTAGLTFDPDGGVSGPLALKDASARLLGGGLIPLTAKLSFVPVGDAAGTLGDAGGLKLTYRARIQVKELKLFGTVSLAVGSSCQTRSAALIPLAAATFDPELGGTLLGTFSLSNLTGCGALTGLVSPLTSGSGNLISLKLAPRSAAPVN